MFLILMKKEIYKETSQETDGLSEKTLLGYIYLKNKKFVGVDYAPFFHSWSTSVIQLGHERHD